MDHQQNLQKIDEIANDIENGMRGIIPKRSNVMPLNVKHHPDVDDVGRLSAEALAASYEASAKRIEDMGNALIDELKSSGQSLLDTAREFDVLKERTQKAVDECKQAAEAYRAEAKVLFEHIQSRAIVADKVRTACIEIIGQIKTT